MGDAMQFRGPQSLWIDLDSAADTTGGGGIVRLIADSLHVHRLYFLPVQPYSDVDPAGHYRCQADADKYMVDPAYADKVTFLGFQRAYDGKDTVAGPRELHTIVAFQDDVRRGVALSYQPQFLADEKAAHQIDYDAVIYASFAHFPREPELRFTDESGRGLALGASWDPAKGKLYLTYTDDFVRSDLAKTLVVRIANGKGAAADSEAAVLAGAAPR